jgi:putative transposase
LVCALECENQGGTMGYLTDLTDEQWAWIEPIFPPQEGRGRRRTVNLRRVIDALMYQDRTGCQWRYIPLDFPPSGTVRYYFDKWNDDGTMLEIHDCLRRAVRVLQGREPEPTAIVIDSQSVKTAEAGGDRGFDGGKQVDGRKRQMVVDTEGNLLTVMVHAADIQDRDGVQPALVETQELCPSVTYAWADQSYRGDLLEWAAKVLGITIEIVTRPAEQVGFQVQPRRWVVERTIAWVNRCRRLSKDVEHLAKNSAAWIYWASIQRMLRYLSPPQNQERPYARKKARSAQVSIVC